MTVEYEFNLVSILGIDTVIAACDYVWEKMKEYGTETGEYSLWINRWHHLHQTGRGTQRVNVRSSFDKSVLRKVA